MKNGKNPTKKQWKIIEDAGLTPDNWLISKNASGRLLLVHRNTGTVREIAV